tara:strand:+ start:407 stop:613 length:207 start_codon:yes stop_codon:yes gene_type:complete
MTHTHTTAEFEKGQTVNYLGQTATIKSVKENVFSEGFSYNVTYFKNIKGNRTRFGATVQSQDGAITKK